MPEKGVGVLLDAWPRLAARREATLVLVGDGPLADRARATPGARLLGPLPRPELPVAYAASELAAAAVDPDRAVPGAVGARVQRGDAPGPADGRERQPSAPSRADWFATARPAWWCRPATRRR